MVNITLYGTVDFSSEGFGYLRITATILNTDIMVFSEEPNRLCAPIVAQGCIRKSTIFDASNTRCSAES